MGIFLLWLELSVLGLRGLGALALGGALGLLWLGALLGDGAPRGEGAPRGQGQLRGEGALSPATGLAEGSTDAIATCRNSSTRLSTTALVWASGRWESVVGKSESIRKQQAMRRAGE